mmetsp:Transcript_32288/g.30784  ORF Transcript_32288/g.30784 Transcript_32288/m.30784 type:complete len:346 (-) Transcript_32288:375-1412(-)|eukprot:CAMPEP_0119043838 /NCGR_PEP_ID=MMETSP1177-20130426/26280_1 /TAXON_ID=2985 /ORGANISM="Ochromonas sp, Strain CCMP1899" /LENGTH=345 /DNA_ID=CAMNT_0007012827 /DNA_START=73 /DNA_END=1110 /DNA_ORIENTATION=-
MKMPSCSMVVSVLVVLIAVVGPLLLSILGGGQAALYISPPYSFKDIPDLTGKVAIVTGSNTGIGYVTARELAMKGAKVIVAARSEEKGKDAVKRIKAEIGDVAGSQLIEFMKLDLGSFAEVRKFAKAFSGKRLAIDMLILNAGVMAPKFGLSADGLETQIATNHFAHFLLVQLLLPNIKRSKARVVTVSSLAHESTYSEGIRFSSFDNDVGYVPFTAYGQSKLANILFANELAERLNDTGATSTSVHPGLIITELGRHTDGAMKENIFTNLLWMVVRNLLATAQLNADGGSYTQLYAATSPKMEGVTGKYLVPIALIKIPSTNARNVTLQKKLWKESERLTKPFW